MKSITIRAADNGFIVETERDTQFDYPGRQFVFNDMGHPSAARDNQSADETLLGWIEKYFKQDVPG